VTSMNSVSCVSTTFCMAVAQGGKAWLWDGQHVNWTTAFPYLAPGISVSCTSKTFCVAASSNGSISVWTGGSTWSTPVSVSSAALISVWCVKSSFQCFVFDSRGRYGSTTNGTSWSPMAAGSPNNVAVQAACFSSTYCIEIDGRYASLGT
jgi:hypothetical protein